jgi:hypothetical protein
MARRVMPYEVRQLVHERAKGRCERCGYGLGTIWECHHRKLRSQGGDNSLSNLIALHPDCHNPGSPGSVHSNPTRSYRLGYMVPSWADAHSSPMLLRGARWVLLGPHGDYISTEAPADV